MGVPPPPRVSVMYGELLIIEAIVCYFTASEGLVHVADCLFTHMCHSFPIPSTISQDLLTRIVQEVLVWWYGAFSYPTIEEAAKVGIGFLIGEIWQVRCQRTTLYQTVPSRCFIAQLCESGSERSALELVWSGGIFLFTRGFIDVFCERANSIHTQAKFFELNTFTRKKHSSKWSNQADKIILIASQWNPCFTYPTPLRLRLLNPRWFISLAILLS